MKIRKTNRFWRTVEYREPDEEKIDGWIDRSFEAQYETIPQNELDKLKAEQDKAGAITALLNRALKAVSKVEVDDEDVDEETGKPLTPLQIIKINVHSANAAALKYWDSINESIEVKNSKRSPAR